ncbi:MAG: hypothetical protein DRI57_22795 [Deltaproteobacteria bacterium]|nr:MAG: hypothetical protein DRI57_22795 [Deltaproteobacteria bacterium]
MRLNQFFHITRASCAVANVEYVAVFGSNAILPWLNDLDIRDMRQFIDPENVSRELDLCVGDGKDDRLNMLIDGAIGELSQFDETFGIYAHPNPVEGLFQAPSSWQKRIRIEKEPISGMKIIVPHYLDLAVSKIIAGRPKDTDFALSVIQVFGVRPGQIEALFEEYIEEHPGEKEKASVNLSVFKHKIG